MNMRINDDGLSIVQYFESKKLRAYLCPAKIWTIGWGHTGKDVYRGLEITEEKALELLYRDLEHAENFVNKLVKVDITENMFSALVSFTFNVGVGNFRGSTLLAKLNRGDILGASKEFSRWIRSNGKVLNGLILRREKERELFLARP